MFGGLHTPRAVGNAGCVVTGSGETTEGAVGCPSGQREQTVNLPASAYEGSNPSPTTRRAGVAQLVEHQPSKLRVTGSIPVASLRSERRRGASSRGIVEEDRTGPLDAFPRRHS